MAFYNKIRIAGSRSTFNGCMLFVNMPWPGALGN